jgi:hypothetical protein
MNMQSSVVLAAALIAGAVVLSNGQPSLLSRVAGGDWELKTFDTGGVTHLARFNRATGDIQICNGADCFLVASASEARKPVR